MIKATLIIDMNGATSGTAFVNCVEQLVLGKTVTIETSDLVKVSGPIMEIASLEEVGSGRMIA